MFLANLAGEQKTAFLDLARALIAADGVLSDNEISMMEQYKLEMALTTTSEESQGQVEQAVDVFKPTPAVVKKQVVFELVALAFADNDYADEEDRLLSEITVSWGLDAAFLDECRVYVKELTDLYQRIGRLVSE